MKIYVSSILDINTGTDKCNRKGAIHLIKSVSEFYVNNKSVFTEKTENVININTLIENEV